MHNPRQQTGPRRRVRCAIYTRKSSEEGLEQDFNSLDAQREACEAFIHSQKHEGWVCLPEMYDDGGFSGGSMDRPALARLLADITAKKVDTVVVYKVDRLTRSLKDFAKIVDVFDERDVSFVSVTQQFNTTTSMGRLTLNMLLSFAQFEREVTSERIRDKFAASKKKGMWMGGFPPLGYDVRDRKLIVNDQEAKTVRHIYERYVALGSVMLTKQELDGAGIRSKTRIDKHGRKAGGCSFSRGALFLLLQNPVYRGLTSHKGTTYPGEHEAIIDETLWSQVQQRIESNRVDNVTQSKAHSPSLLSGLVFDDTGVKLTCSGTIKGGVRYRYYISSSLVTGNRSVAPSGIRIPAGELESLVEQQIRGFLADDHQLHSAVEVDDVAAREKMIARAAELGRDWDKLSEEQRRLALIAFVDRIVITRGCVDIEVLPARLPELLLGDIPKATKLISRHPGERAIALTVPAQLKRSGTEMKLLVEDVQKRARRRADHSMHRLLARASQYNAMVMKGAGRSIAKLAADADVSASYFARVFRLSFLAPDIVQAMLRNTHPADLTAKRLANETKLPLNWSEQRSLFRID